MPWSCPLCKKEFVKQNQYHKCETIPVDVLFKFNHKFLALYRELIKQAGRLGKIKITTSLKAISLSRQTCFAVLYPKKDGVDIGIFLDSAADDFVVYKKVSYTKIKTVNWVRIYDTADIKEIKGLMKKAYSIAL
ncbi:MAG: DUF5655 domain-containing protein [Chitinophagaceae bacterium]|nr:DUF5655 domain-containing protein [Chitinophagaceae bacterium]